MERHIDIASTKNHAEKESATKIPDSFSRKTASNILLSGWEFCRSENRLKKNQKEIRLEPKSTDLLLLLVEADGKALSRSDIISHLWPNVYASDDSLNQIVSRLRRALAVDKALSSAIITVPKRGYRIDKNVFAQVKNKKMLNAQPDRNLGRTPFTGLKAPMIQIGIASAILAATAAGLTLLAPTSEPDYFNMPSKPFAKLVGYPSGARFSTAGVTANVSGLNSPGYEAFLFGSKAMKEGAYEMAERLFTDAVEIDANFAAAFVGLAHATVYNRGGDFSKVADAQHMLDKALEIDPTLPAAHLLNARLALYYWRDHDLARREIQRSLELAPNDPDVLTTAAYFFTITGDPQTALNTISRAHVIAPLSPALNADYGWVHYKARNWTHAERLCKTSVDLNLRSPFALECVIHINHSQGDFAEAAEFGMRLMALRRVPKSEIASIRSIADPRERERAFWSWMVSWYEKRERPNQLAKHAIALSMVGRLDEAVVILDKAFQKNGEPLLSFVAVDPRLDEMRTHEEFERFAELSRTPVRFDN